MSVSIQALFITPAMAIARLGGSTTPLHAYDWIDTRRVRLDGETEIAPSWTLAVKPDGSVEPFLPMSIAFRDGDLIRPVAPFFEIWARLGEPGSEPSTWTEEPLTTALLASDGLALNALRLAVTARNLKAARRTGRPELGFGNWQPLEILGNDFVARAIEGKSPPDAAMPMIPLDRHIPLGTVQMLRSSPQLTGQPWSESVRVDTIRFRFTPARGTFYGPGVAASADVDQGRPEPAVPAANAFLDPAAGWSGASTSELLNPADTYDVVNQNDGQTGPSLGVVDDTCEVHFEISLDHEDGRTLTSRAIAFVAPPDFAPDRRPFLSVADELNDRDGSAAVRNAALTGEPLDRWVEDLFERIYETVSLFNLDDYRQRRASRLPANKLQTDDVDGGLRLGETRAMGGRDALRNQMFPLPRDTNNDPLPLSQHARMRHRALSDIQNLLSLVTQDALTGRNRVSEIVRAPFEVEGFETASFTSMRMPPFMRQSNALPLTLASWQYELLMRWVNEVHQRALLGVAGAGAAQLVRSLSPSAASRRSSVLARIEAEEKG
jgi:hypothetical protein